MKEKVREYMTPEWEALTSFETLDNTYTLEEDASVCIDEYANNSSDSNGANNSDDKLKENSEVDDFIPWHTDTNLVNSYQDAPKFGETNEIVERSYDPLDGETNLTHLTDDNEQQRNQAEDDIQPTGWLKKTLGIFLALLSGVLMTTNNFIIKGFNVVSTDLVLVRSVLQIIFLGVLIKLQGITIWQLMTKKQRLLIVGEGVAGGVSMVAAVGAVTMMPVADALTIMFCSPLVTIILAAIFLGDRLTLVKIFGGLSLTSGVVLVCQPPFLFPPALLVQLEHSKEYWIGVSLSATVAVSSGTINVSVSQLKTVPSVVLVWWAGLGGLLLSLCTAPLESDSKIASSSIVDISLSSWLLMVGLSISGLLAYLAMTHSLQLISPTLVASLRSLEIVLSYLVQTALSGISPSPLSCGGGALVTLGVLTVALESAILNRWRLIRWRSQYQQL